MRAETELAWAQTYNQARTLFVPVASISVESLAGLLEQFLASAPNAVAIEDGAVLFDFCSARYSMSGEGKCVLHIWSEDRNTVRRVLDAEVTPHSLRLQVLRFGQSQPNLLEICVERDYRTGTARRSARARYQSLLERLVRREYPGFKLAQVSSSPDLEHSFSSVYTRGLLRAGQRAFAVLGVNSEETQTSVDAALTFGILWMDYQRKHLAGRAVVEGLKLFVPPRCSEIVRQRAANLNPEAAKWQLYELDERSETVSRSTLPTAAISSRGSRARWTFKPLGNASRLPLPACENWCRAQKPRSNLLPRLYFAFMDWSSRGLA